MSELIQAVLDHPAERTDLRRFMGELRNREQRYLLHNDILSAFADYCHTYDKEDGFVTDSALSRLIDYTQEVILERESMCMIIRPKIGYEEVYRVLENLTVEEMSVQEILDLRDRFVNHFHPEEGDVLEVDLLPFYDYSPRIRDPKNIGKGVEFLNRYLSSKLFQDPTRWLEVLYQFLSLHRHNSTQLLINARINSQQKLSDQVKHAINFVGRKPADEPFNRFRFEFQDLGFEPGWGNTAGRVRETLELLDHLLDSPDHQALEAFISRIPMVFKVVLTSVHGWFGQEGVLGRPDTGGQVVYVLDQARSIEKQLQEEIELAGLDIQAAHPKVIILSRLIPNSDGTTCNQRLEKVYGTQNAWILRVPFRELNPKYTQNWISRFEIWPYLETYAIDAERELLAELQGKPDLIIGNYTDGNLVAFLLARRLKVTQCNVAHALEKSKYLFSNLYWQDLENEYHFSLQFTADLIAMNAANFIISSTYQEIAGTPTSVGQYESYRRFTMPELYHVVNGVDLFSPKFNVVPPGVDVQTYFPFSREDRLESDRQRLDELIFTREDPAQAYGKLKDPSKRPIFSMARLDRIKNLTGLAECFGQSKELQERCNLILIAGKLRAEESGDREELAEMEKLYRIIDEYGIYENIRWLGIRLPKSDSGEVYRVIADREGIFVQPALFEAFGLTILEAMISGLPTFGTRFGGPLEIIQDKHNGFYINPTHLPEMAAVILEFLGKCDQNPGYWKEVSDRAIERVYSTYTWKIHSSKLMSLAKIYGFWNYSSKENREDMLRYIEMIFYLLYRPGAKQLLGAHMQT
ncbi:MAG: sucrose synthase [Cyanobacteria bacterium P01_A01_bin.135]